VGRARHVGRGHAASFSNTLAELSYELGLDLIRSGRYFEAHEALEDAWRAAEPEERDFLQGLVHVAVAWYQAGRGRRIGCERQLEKATRRLTPYAPSHRGLDVTLLLESVAEAQSITATGRLELPAPHVR
jgi:predicted metal-dependent hydrolase